MRQSGIRQVDLFENIEHAKTPWPMELNAEEMVLLVDGVKQGGRSRCLTRICYSKRN